MLNFYFPPFLGFAALFVPLFTRSYEKWMDLQEPHNFSDDILTQPI